MSLFSQNDVTLVAVVDYFETALKWFVATSELHLWFAPYIVFLVVEHFFGRRERASVKEVIHNFGFLAIWVVAFTLINPFLTKGVALVAAKVGGPYFDLTFETGSDILRNIAALLVYFLIYDFFSYWWHRMQHALPILWVTHKLHHADQNLGVTTTMKEHPVSFILRTFIIALPIAVLFRLTPVTVFWVAYSVKLYGHFVHANIDCHLGWLNKVFTSPNQHRVHHSVLREHRDKNFATYFSIIDVIFGTYKAPEKNSAVPTGLDTGETFPTLWADYSQPFKDWWRMGKRWVSAKA